MAVAAEEVNVNNEEESEDEEEPSIEVVAEGEEKRPAKRRRLKVYVVFHGDRASRRLPHSVRIKCPRDGSWETGARGPELVKQAFTERYATVHGEKRQLSECYLVNRHGVVVADDDELRYYVENDGVLHVLLGASPKKKPNVVAQFGYNALATSERLAPSPVAFLTRKRVVSLSCGWLHCCAVLDSGRAVAWGSNEFGQLGTGDEKKSAEAVLCDTDPAIRLTSVACGSYFTNVLDADGVLYSWGRYQASNSPTKFVDTWVNGYEKKGEKGIKGEVVVEIAAGEAHTVVRTQSGAVFSWGYNEQWQLGWGQTESDHQGQQKPRLVKLPASFAKPAKTIAAGGLHTCVVDANGVLYAFGSNYEGQIGHVIRQANGEPQPVSSMENEQCRAVYCGRHATLVVTEKNDAFLYGSLTGSAAQQQGTQQQEETKALDDDGTPTFGASAAAAGSGAARMLAGAAKQHVGSDVDVAALGEAHGLLLKKSTRLLAGWGYNAYGQALGVLDSKTDVIDTPRVATLPADVYDPSSQSVLALAVAGGTTTLLVSPSGCPSPAE